MKVLNLVPYNAQNPGRLAYELKENKQKVILRIFEEIHRSALIMGISVDAQIAKQNAIESSEQIRKQYPHAHLDDICNAIRMGAFGQIKLENQLNTLSAANIYGWYREMRLNHQDKMTSPPPPPFKEPEMTQDEIRQEMINGVERFLSDPNQLEALAPAQYDLLTKYDVLKASESERTDMYLAELYKLIENPPLEFMTNKQSREKVREIQNYYDSLEDKKKFKFLDFSDNPIHRRAIFNSKARLVTNFAKNCDKKETLKVFIENYNKKVNGTK